MSKGTTVTVQSDDADTNGITLRALLAKLRNAGSRSFGDIGTERHMLSDRSELCVELQRTDDGSAYLMSSQRIVRRAYDSRTGERIVRTYSW